MTAQEYADKVAAMPNPYPCKYGHFSCALWRNGPCMDELLSLAEAAEAFKQKGE